MDSMVNQSDLPWYRQVNREQWKAFFATFFGWLLDGFAGGGKNAEHGYGDDEDNGGFS